MKKWFAILGLMIQFSCFAQTAQDSVSVVRMAATWGYVGAWFNGDGDAMEASLHPHFIKHKVTSASAAKVASVSGLISNAGSRSPQSFESVNLAWEILDITGNVAAMRVTNTGFWDFIFLTKYDTTWLVTNVLWDNYTPPEAGTREGAKKTGENFIRALYEGDETTLEQLMHPFMDMRRPVSKDKVDSVNKTWLIDQAKAKRWEDLDGADLVVEAELLDMMKSNAMVKVISNWGAEYIHMKYIEPQWYIVNGVWQRSSSEDASIEKAVPGRKKSIQLLQNYPNPFNPKTDIRYQISGLSEVELDVFDVQGRKITTLFNDYKNPGDYQIIWNAAQYAAGIYYLQMRTNHSVEMKKMILLK